VRAFGVTKISLKRAVKRYREEGPKGFYTHFPSPRSTKPLARTGLDGNFGFHAGGYIATCNKPSISFCSGVGVLF
jgi:hypothetical protein